MGHLLRRNARDVLGALQVHALVVVKFRGFVLQLAPASMLGLVELLRYLLILRSSGTVIRHEEVLASPVKTTRILRRLNGFVEISKW